MKSPELRRKRLRPMRIAYPGDSASRGAFDPPLLSLGPRHLRRVLANGERTDGPLESVCDELWFTEDDRQIRGALVAEDRLGLTAFAGADSTPIERRLVRIPLGPDKDHGGMIGRWEFGRDRAVLSTRGAGLITQEGAEITIDRPPVRLDVHRGPGVVLALRNVPNGAIVEHAEGVEGLPAGTTLSDIRVPDIEKGPSVEVHPLEAFLCGFSPLGFKASFGGLEFAGFARAQGEGSPDLARFTRRSRGVAWGAVRPLDSQDAGDATLARALTDDLRPRDTIGRCRLGKPGTITLSDGRRFRVSAASVERLPRGAPELIVAALLTTNVDDAHALLVRVCAPVEAFEETPSAELVLARLKDFLLGVHTWPL